MEEYNQLLNCSFCLAIRDEFRTFFEEVLSQPSFISTLTHASTGHHNDILFLSFHDATHQHIKIFLCQAKLGLLDWPSCKKKM